MNYTSDFDMLDCYIYAASSLLAYLAEYKYELSEDEKVKLCEIWRAQNKLSKELSSKK